MTIRKNSIVVRKELDGEWSETHYRVEDVNGRSVRVRNLNDYTLATEDVGNLTLRYQVDTFERGDTVRVRKVYAFRYNEADGENRLTVVNQKSGNIPTAVVRNSNGDEFSILNERIYLVKPAKVFKAGDRVVVDPALMEKYDYDGDAGYWTNVGVMVLTEDSGSRSVQSTSHIMYEKDDQTNNVPTRWLKLYVEPAKRVVGGVINAFDVKVGDKVKATDAVYGLTREYTGVVAEIVNQFGMLVFRTRDGGKFPEYNTVYTLLEEAPEPVDENLQRLLDAEIGDIAFGTYANEYWIKEGENQWVQTGDTVVLNTNSVFDCLHKVRYGTLVFYREVEDGGQ